MATDLIGIDQLPGQIDRVGVFAARVVDHELQLAGLAANIGIFLHEHVDGILLLLAVRSALARRRDQDADTDIGHRQ